MDTALKNNLTVKNERLRAEYNKQLINTARLIPATTVSGDVGQMNSIYVDTKLGIAQGLRFPRVYAVQKTMLTEEWKSSVLTVGIKESLLKKQVAQAYHSLVYLQQKKNLLLKNDSLFAEFLRRATLRFDKGETNILEKVTAENQRGQIALQLSQLQQDMDLQQLQFQLLLNTSTVFIPEGNEWKTIAVTPDTSFLSHHPTLRYLYQQERVAAAATEIEKAKLLPDITLGYNIMSMRGTGADNKSYNSIPRFQSVQVGMGIPIFTSGQRARITAAKTNELLVANDRELAAKNLEAAYRAAFAQYRKYQEAVKYFETTGLKNAAEITGTANKQFLNGDINYLDWVLLVNQATTIQSEYLEAIRNRNESIIEINSFNVK